MTSVKVKTRSLQIISRKDFCIFGYKRILRNQTLDFTITSVVMKKIEFVLHSDMQLTTIAKFLVR
jgi:hypothetical protein